MNFRIFNPDIAAQESRLQPDQAFPAVYPVPVGTHRLKPGLPVIHIRTIFSKFISRSRLSLQYTAVEASIQPAKAGTPSYSYPDYFLQIHQRSNLQPANL
jgi:hypothetical protein